MKKRVFAALMAAAMTASLMACGSSTAETTAETETVNGLAVEETTEDAVDYSDVEAYDFGLNYEELVQSLPDYMGITLEVSDEYEVTDEAANAYLQDMLAYYCYYYGLTNTVKVEGKTVVEADDYVNVDYVGKVDGEAFDNGSATDQTISVAGNCDASGSGSFIDGFTDALPGAEVGTTIVADVTFPESYSNTDLAGVDATFDFTINYICELVTFDNIDDDFVADNYSTYLGVSTVAELRESVDSALESTLENAVCDAAEAYMAENAVVEVPDDYMQERMSMYQSMLEYLYCDGQTLEEYLGDEYDSYVEQWNSSLLTSLTEEIAFGRVAELEDILEVSDDDIDSYINNVLSYYSYYSSNYAAVPSTESDVYLMFGAGDASKGKAYVEMSCMYSNALRYIAENAEVVFTETEE